MNSAVNRSFKKGWILFGMVLCSGCVENQERVQTDPKDPTPTSRSLDFSEGSLLEESRVVPEHLEGDYIFSQVSSSLGEAKKYVLREEVFQRKRGEFAHQSLEELELSSDQTRVFRMEGENPESTSVVLRPRLLIKNSLLNEETDLEILPTGQIQIRLDLALVTGLKKFIQHGIFPQETPRSYLIENPVQFLSNIQSQVSGSLFFQSQVPCPERISVRIGGERVFPIQWSSSSCPLDTFFPASLTFSSENWNRVKKTLLRTQSLDVETEINLAPSLTQEYVEFRINPEGVFNWIQSELRLSPISSEFSSLKAKELQGLFKKLVQKIQTEFSTPFPESFFTSFETKVTETFFLKERVQKEIHFSLKPSPSLRDSFEFSVKKKSYLGRSMSFHTRSSLKDQS